jgi:hypothetical protein
MKQETAFLKESSKFVSFDAGKKRAKRGGGRNNLGEIKKILKEKYGDDISKKQ